MAMEIANLGLPRFGIGAVLSLSFSSLKNNFLQFFLLSLLVTAPVVLAGFAFGYIGYTAGFSILMGVSPSPREGAVFILLSFILVGGYLFLNGAISYGVIQDLRGYRVGIGDCIRQTFRALPQLIGTAIVMVLTAIVLIVPLALTYYYLILLIPAMLFILVCWWLVVPVIFAERPGVSAALSRSVALTSGYRWSVFAILLAMSIINWMTDYIVSVFEPISTALFILSSFVTGLIISIWNAILPAIGYCLLRNQKEGADITALAKVFE